jgi:restriction endonuclease Mrr
MRSITVCKETQNEKGVHMWAVQVGEDKYAYYVRMTAVNRTKRPYRIVTPSVSHIIPAFGAKITVKSVNQQLTPKQFSQIKLYDSVAVASHGSTLTSRDLEPKEAVTWVMAVSKAGHPVGIYQFSLPPDGKKRVQAAVIF